MTTELRLYNYFFIIKLKKNIMKHLNIILFVITTTFLFSCNNDDYLEADNIISTTEQIKTITSIRKSRF